MSAKLFDTKKKRESEKKWINIEYPCSNQVLTKSLINKMVNRLWLENFKEVNEKENYLILMFRVRLASSGEIKTITKLQRLKFESKEYLKSFIDLKSFLLKELYSDQPIKSIIFSYGVRAFSKLRNEFKDTIYSEMGPIKQETLIHNYKSYKLPLSTDLTKYGKILLETPQVKIIVLDSKTNLNIKIENRCDGFTYYYCDYIKNNKVRISWVDKILSLVDDHLIRTIGQTIVEYRDNTFVSIKTLRKFKKIKSIKPSNKQDTKIISADIETVLNKNKVMEPYLASLYQKDSSGYEININIEQLFESFFKRIFSRKNRGFNIYFHNLSGFDGFFILRYLFKFGYEISPLMHSGKLIQIDVNKGRNSWSLRDSNLLLLSSLDKLSKSFNVESYKGIFPYFLSDLNYNGSFPEYKYFNTNKVSLQEYELEKSKFFNSDWNFKIEAIKYCLNDSKVLFQILSKFNQLIFDKFQLNINQYPTLPSLAFAIFRSKYLPEVNKDISIITGKVKNEIQSSYTGGSTDMFIPSLLSGKKLYAYDVNSLYPYVMLTNDYPIGDPTYIEYPNFVVLNKETDIFGFFYCKIVAPEAGIPHPVLQIHHNNRTISPIGVFSGWFFSEELKNALSFGYKITIERGYLFEKGKIFEGYVNDLYQMRTSYPKSDPMNYIAKILLNSLYGRFGMTDIFSDIITILKKDFENWTEKDKIDIEDIIEFDNHVLLKFKPESSLEQDLNGSDHLTANVNIAIAAAVTAYARIHMSQFKNNTNLPSLYYSDTDSLYFDEPLPDFMVDSNRLGALKLEGVWDKALFLAPKVYALENLETGEQIIKIKGLSKEAIKDSNISLESLSLLLNKEYKIAYNHKKWFKNLSKANIQVLDQIYTLRVTDNKRELVFDGELLVNTYPFNLNNP